MMNTTTRLVIVAILVGLLAGSTYILPNWLKPKSVELPTTWALTDMPLQFGSWQGTEVEPDPEVRDWLLRDTEAVVDLTYGDDRNHVVSLHAAFFSDLDAGVRHSPINCYRGNGWRELDRTRLMLHVSDETSIPVSLSTWEREGEQVLVMYWFQLDEHILFNRWDLFWARVDMRGKETWPPLVKVLLQTQTRAADADNADKARERIQAIARGAYEWINQPAHQPAPGSANDLPAAG